MRLAHQRIRHVVWAGLLALAMHFLALVSPLDFGLRLVQHQLHQQPASGTIALVATLQDPTDPAFPQRREDLARLITRIDAAGAKAIYLNMVFTRPSNPASDAALNAALRATQGRARLVAMVTTSLDGRYVLERPTRTIAAGVPQVGSYLWTDFLGYAWQMQRRVRIGGADLPNLASALAGQEGAADGRFAINYFFAPSSIPSHRLETLDQDPAAMAALAGKIVVIGPMSAPSIVNIPGLPGVSPSLIHIYAAETLIDGRPVQIRGLVPLLLAVVLLGLAALIPHRRWRRRAYALLAIVPLVALWIAAQMALRIDLAAVVVLLFAFAIWRGRAAWQRQVSLTDPDTRLPTFAALEADRETAELAPALIVAKVHRFDEVRRTLPRDLHVAYLLRIIARLKAATADATIYVGQQGHLLAWTMPEGDITLLREHLLGLRALFASPLLVGDQQVDVGITFGVDVTPSPQVGRRLASAITATEATSETFEPIRIAENASEEDLIWNISLQARIDAALAHGEIYLDFQPKVNLATNQLVGAEALVRWRDPTRGQIPPDRFIRQCENAGRMSHLTRHVLREACRAAIVLGDAGHPVPIAVNISATLLHEHSLVRMVREVLAETGVPAGRLMLEVTETYRIANLARAAEILAELRALGLRISMDDFGVGAASLEALLELPFDELKIDRVFCSRMASDPKAAGIVRSVLQLGRELAISVVAEGVEDAASLQMLRLARCPIAQGYALCRPVALADVIAFAQAGRNRSSPNMV